MEHTLSLHDSSPGHTPAPEPFELPAPYDPPPAPFEPSASYEAAASLHSFPPAEPAEAPDGWVQEEVPAEAGEHHHEHGYEHHHEHGYEQEPAYTFASADAVRRIVLRLSGGETVELGTSASAESAVEEGREAVRRIAQAEANGEWPEFDGRFLRPDTIVSVDIQVGP